MLKRLKLCDYKTDIFLGANVMDAIVSYVALQHGTQFTEFNAVLSAMMNTIGIGATLLLKLVLCLVILWILRKTKREKLLAPLAAIFVMVAFSNLIVVRLHGFEI